MKTVYNELGKPVAIKCSCGHEEKLSGYTCTRIDTTMYGKMVE